MNVMEQYGIKGFTAFSEHYSEIFKNYQKYGNVVLEKDLHDGEEEVKHIIVNSKFTEEFDQKIMELFKAKYHVTLKCCEEFETVYEELCVKNKIGFFSKLPSSDSISKDSLGPKYYIDSKFLKKLIETRFFHGSEWYGWICFESTNYIFTAQLTDKELVNWYVIPKRNIVKDK